MYSILDIKVRYVRYCEFVTPYLKLALDHPNDVAVSVGYDMSYQYITILPGARGYSQLF